MPPVQPKLLPRASAGTVGGGVPPHLLGAWLLTFEDLGELVSGDRVIGKHVTVFAIGVGPGVCLPALPVAYPHLDISFRQPVGCAHIAPDASP
jgi:hypothetical protein